MRDFLFKDFYRLGPAGMEGVPIQFIFNRDIGSLYGSLFVPKSIGGIRYPASNVGKA